MGNVVSLQEIKNIVHNDDEYNGILQYIKDTIEEDIDNSANELKWKDYLQKTQMDMSTGYFMLTLLKPYNVFKELELDKDDILADYTKIGSFDDYSDRVIKKYQVTDTLVKEKGMMPLMEAIFYAYNDITRFASKEALLKKGPTVSIKDILDIGKRHPEFYETLNFKHSEKTSHIENIQDKIKVQDENARKSLDIIVNDEENQFKDLVLSGGGVNVNQLAEVINVVGYKPDILGRVVPKPVDSSFLRGLDSVYDYYTDAQGGRKALITSKMQVKQSGYLNRKISVMTEDARIVRNHVCNTKNFLKVKIENEKMFKMFIDRYYNVDGKDVLLTKNDKHLIGATLNFRSPVFCACGGDNVCEKCYGLLANVNLYANIGTLANLIFTEPITQGLLSSKHLLKVKVDFKFSPEFLNYLSPDGETVVPLERDRKFYIDKEDFHIREDNNFNKYRTRVLYTDGKKKGELVRIESPTYLILPDIAIYDINEYYNHEEDRYEFSMSMFNEVDYLFKVTIKNTGIADPLLAIKDGLDKNYMMKEKHSYDVNSFLQELFELMVKSNVNVMAVHLEVIVRCMMEVYGDRVKVLSEKEVRPIVDYTLRNINDAIYFSNSPVKSLMYQNTAKQLMTDSFNNNFGKSGDSEFDRLFLELD